MKKSVSIMFHLMFWIFTSLMIILVFQLLYVSTGLLKVTEPGTRTSIVSVSLLALLVILPIGACIFYASYYSLNFFLKRPFRFIWIPLGYALFTIIVSIPGYWASQQSLDNSGKNDLLNALLSIMIIVAPILYFNVFGFLFKTFMEWVNDRKIKAELEKDKIASQLELLKSKINPHFLFNTLNNIDILIQDDSQKASEYLNKLSEILRFMLYESGTEKISLITEIDYIRKYVDLQRIRTANINFVKLEINGNVNNKTISPMILIHFIENAFKFATNKKIKNAVFIRFDISEKRLSFFCKNHVHEKKEINGEKNGIGVGLLKQKLELLYKNNYSLETKKENNWYIVTLEIQLDEN